MEASSRKHVGKGIKVNPKEKANSINKNEKESKRSNQMVEGNNSTQRKKTVQERECPHVNRSVWQRRSKS